MPTSARILERLATGLGEAEALDGPADLLSAAAAKVLVGPVKDLAAGVPVGHPLHPALAAVPIGLVSGAAVLDLTGGDPAAARRMVGGAVLSAGPTALAGLADWSDTTGAERRVGMAHILVNGAGLALAAASWWRRRRGQGRLLGMAGLGLVTAGGWLGGRLAYALGVGVDTTAFVHSPTEWTDVAEEGEVSQDDVPVVARAGEMAVVLIRRNGQLLALADRCTHRGGPLHEGEVADGCITCPWHGSRFRLSDGEIVDGPASRPQPALQTRVLEGRIQVRRADSRSLRTNPV